MGPDDIHDLITEALQHWIGENDAKDDAAAQAAITELGYLRTGSAPSSATDAYQRVLRCIEHRIRTTGGE